MDLVWKIAEGMADERSIIFSMEWTGAAFDVAEKDHGAYGPVGHIQTLMTHPDRLKADNYRRINVPHAPMTRERAVELIGWLVEAIGTYDAHVALCKERESQAGIESS